MLALAWLLAGGVAGAALILLGRRRPDQGRTVFAVGLAVAALLYVLFAAAGANVHGVILEAVGFSGFAWVAWIGWRKWPILLAAGWTVHVVWDVVLHLLIPSAYIGAWYPTVCLSLDLLVAAYIFYAFRHQARRSS